MVRRLEWSLLFLFAAVGILLWCQLALPRYQSIDLSVDQAKAIEIARDFMVTQRKVDLKGYRTAIDFNVDGATDRFLQKTLGIEGSRRLIRRIHYDLFCWVVRFFKEKQKEEYRIAISSATGEIFGFSHLIEDTASRPVIDKDKARRVAFDFLSSRFGFKKSQFIVHGEDVHKYDNRQDYGFSWEDKDIDIPWNQSNEKGSAKLLTSVTVSGNEILNFTKYQFEIPDGFKRYIENLKQTGENLTLVFRIFYLALMTIAIVVVVNRKHQVVSRSVKPFYIAIGTAIFIMMALDVFNSYQELLYEYPTTQSLWDYIIRQLINSIIGPLFIAVGFVLPALAGESLLYEVTPKEKHRGFFSALLSSFCSVNIARQIFIGYFAAAIVLGVQSLIFSLGFKYCGVWDELSWLTQDSTTYIPAFTALMIGFQASFSEESMFRLFAINLFKKHFHFFSQYGIPTILAVFLSALMWGFGHTGYEIFPMWFRGVEVTTIGIIMGFLYLRFGLVCVIVSHYLVDAFITSMPYLLKPGPTFNFYSSVFVVVLPFLLALIALKFNKNIEEKPISIRFNAQQQFNYDLLQQVYRSKSPQERLVLKNDLERHGWDQAIILRVFGEEK